jgi:asparagine synthase (glutamine-hydrolysing)
MSTMIPRSGFYALIDPLNRVARDDFNVERLPAPQISTEERRMGAWSEGPLEAAVAGEGNRWLAFHGTLYNRPDLIRQLGLSPQTPTMQLLLQAWRHWPADWISRLDGIYALAYWTGDGRDLTLRRDASGALGMFYGTTGSRGIALSSHLGTLMRLPGMERRLSPQGLHEYLRLLDIAAPNTIYRGVRAVPAGAGVVLDARHPGVETSLPVSDFPAIDIPFEDAVQLSERQLAASIARRLDGLTRPAAFLSGGIDSSLICALASRQRREIEAVTVGFDPAVYDEAPAARQIAEHLGIRHRVLRFDRQELLGALAKAGMHSEQPMADPTEPVTLIAFEQVQRDYDAVLEGTGADEHLGAMPPRHTRVAVEYAARIPVPVRRGIAAALKPLPLVNSYAPFFDYEHPAETLMRWRGFERSEIERLCGGPVDLEQTRLYQTFSRFAPGDHYARYSALIDAMPSDRLSQAVLATGLDVRFPFYGPGVAASLRGLPLAYRWQTGTPKVLLRAMLARHVPQRLWDIPKHGFNFPFMEFLGSDDFQLVRRYLRESDWRRWQLLAPAQIADYAQRFISGERQLGFRIWALVVLAAWLEGHGE